MGNFESAPWLNKSFHAGDMLGDIGSLGVWHAGIRGGVLAVGYLMRAEPRLGPTTISDP